MSNAQKRAKRKASVSHAGQLDGITRHRRLEAVETRAVAIARSQSDVLRDLRHIPERRAVLDARQRELVDQARALGVGWGVLGAALGVSAQAVQKRYGSTS